MFDIYALFYFYDLYFVCWFDTFMFAFFRLNIAHSTFPAFVFIDFDDFYKNFVINEESFYVK